MRVLGETVVQPPDSSGWIHPSQPAHQHCCPSSECFKDCQSVMHNPQFFTLNMADALSSGPPSSRATAWKQDKNWHFHHWCFSATCSSPIILYIEATILTISCRSITPFPSTSYILHREEGLPAIWWTGRHLNAHCSFSFGLPPEVTSIANRNSLKSMKLFLSLSKVLKPKTK